MKVTNMLLFHMQFSIEYYSEDLRVDVMGLPVTLAARYIALTRRMVASGPNLGEPHTKALGDGLFEIRLKGAEGIARVMYCTLVDRKIVMLHSFIKKTQKTPHSELAIALQCMKEVKQNA